jgi:hypothetical protein
LALARRWRTKPYGSGRYAVAAPSPSPLYGCLAPLSALKKESPMPSQPIEIGTTFSIGKQQYVCAGFSDHVNRRGIPTKLVVVRSTCAEFNCAQKRALLAFCAIHTGD